MPAKVQWRDFEEAREFARGLGLRGVEEWRAWAKTGEKPKDIPASPPKVYMGQWAGWGAGLVLVGCVMLDGGPSRRPGSMCAHLD